MDGPGELKKKAERGPVIGLADNRSAGLAADDAGSDVSDQDEP